MVEVSKAFPEGRCLPLFRIPSGLKPVPLNRVAPGNFHRRAQSHLVVGLRWWSAFGTAALAMLHSGFAFGLPLGEFCLLVVVQ